MKFQLFVIVLAILYKQIVALKILAIFPSASNSHLILGKALLKGLAERGHDVTMVSSYPLSEPVPNYHDIKMRNLNADLLALRGIGNDDSRKLVPPSTTMIEFWKYVYDFGHDLAQLAIEDIPVKNLLQSNATFDIVISEMFMNEVFFALGDHFKVPIIGFSTIGAMIWNNDHVGNPAPYSISPESILDYTDHMTFFQRLYNSYVALTNQIVYNFYNLPRQEKLRQKHLPHTKSLAECIKDTSLVFVNSHPSFSIPKAYVPNMIEIGGFHVEKPKPLPTDLKTILDESKNGAIYFSMGGNFLCKHFSVAALKAFIEVFSNLKQTILWKCETDDLPSNPKNIVARKWFPQSDILAHPNLKIFMTHGGLLSTIESVTRGVPVLGIPIGADQKYNMRKAEQSGYGISLNFANITTNSVFWALNEILSNPSYTENVKKRSDIMNDRIVHPLDEANYWVEYVHRHKGAKHLRSARNDLSLVQYLLLDVIGFILFISISGVVIIYFSVKKLMSKFFGKKISKKVKVN